MKIGVYFLADASGGNGRGDVLLLTPALRALRAKYPDAFIGCVIRHSELLAGNPYIDRYYEAQPISRLPFDELYQGADLHLYVDYQAYHPYRQHLVDVLGELCGVRPRSRQPDLFLLPDEELVAQQLTQQIRQAEGNRPLVALHTSATTPNREWELPKWQELVASCADLTFVLLGGAADPPIEGTVRLAGQLTARQSAALVKYCDGFVGIDSYMQHAAAAVGTRGVILCGASDPLVCGHTLHTYLISREVECVPCFRPLIPLYDLMPDPQNSSRLVPWVCPHRMCMQRVTVADVKAALRSVLATADTSMR